MVTQEVCQVGVSYSTGLAILVAVQAESIRRNEAEGGDVGHGAARRFKCGTSLARCIIYTKQPCSSF